MSFSATKCTPVYLWFSVVLFGYGWAQDVSNISQTKGVRVPTNGSIRHRRASSNEVTSSCSAPPQPNNGEWKLDRFFCEDKIADCTIPEGTVLEPGSQLVYRCNTGYWTEENTDVYCRGRGEWSRIPSCIEVKCASLTSASTMVSCTRFGQWINCDSPVAPQTRAEVSCRHGYKKDTDFITARRGVVNCNVNGKWEPEPIKCVPVCGVAITHQQPFIYGGTPAKIGDFPWHASLFTQIKSPRRNRKVFLCGATVIHTNLVLTAAHCVYDERIRTTEDPENLFLITGNVFRDYDSTYHNSEVVRKANVKNVYMSCNYYGINGNYASDIALLELQQPFQFSSTLLPACLDNSDYTEQFLEPGIFGRVAGFGRTAKGATSGILQTITVPYISYGQCKASINMAQIEAFISNDKFCAGYNNGSAVCEGDSGGGLVFRKGGLWYVMGIISVGLGVDLDNGEKTCDKYSYSLYTKVPIYMTWIQDVLFYVERNAKYPSCSHNLKLSPTTSTTPTSTVSWPPTTKPSIAKGLTNWWDHLTSAAPEVTTPHKAEPSCFAPRQPLNGERKLHKDFCKGDMICDIREGTAVISGTQLVYSCASGYMVEGVPDAYCGSKGSWTSIPRCIEIDGSDCTCVAYYKCNTTLDVDTHVAESLIDSRLSSGSCPGILDVCCPKSYINFST